MSKKGNFNRFKGKNNNNNRGGRGNGGKGGFSGGFKDLKKMYPGKDSETEAVKPIGEATGEFIAHPKGFGFVRIEDREQDVFVPERLTHGAFHGDTVVVSLFPEPTEPGKRQEGRIERVVEHSLKQAVGVFQQSRNYGFVVADNPRIIEDIFIPKQFCMGARDGYKVLVELTKYGGNGMKPEGRVVQIIGHVNEPGTDILSVVFDKSIPNTYPPEVIEQADEIRDTVDPKDMEGRLDLRKEKMVTIDGADTKDIDDAVSLTYDGELFHLGVHIADVSQYVTEGSPLDKEAKERGTSVYLVDRVVPMLPKKLSNGICSLNEGVDRLAMSCLMDVDKKGRIVNYKIAETVINVNRRMTYTGVQAVLDKDPAARKEYRGLCTMFEQMERLSKLMRKARHERGSIDFDFPETVIDLDSKGRPVNIKAAERIYAQLIIEDFMLAANETVGEEFNKREIPFLYRVHETPDPDRIQDLSAYIANLGYGVKTTQGKVTPKEIQQLLEKVKGKPEEAVIDRLTLRSMSQAHYSPDCLGHFGLAAEYYSHFTSPIRRYPDLQIHRIIKETLRGQMTKERKEHYEKILESVAGHSSDTERRAVDAEREVDKMKMAEYMSRHIGEVSEGVISGVTAYGVYVELPSTVEGMIHVSNMLDDHYDYRPETYDLYGQRTGKVYKLGMKVKVQIKDADKEKRTIDFVFA